MRDSGVQMGIWRSRFAPLRVQSLFAVPSLGSEEFALHLRAGATAVARLEKEEGFPQTTCVRRVYASRRGVCASRRQQVSETTFVRRVASRLRVTNLWIFHFDFCTLNDICTSLASHALTKILFGRHPGVLFGGLLV